MATALILATLMLSNVNVAPKTMAIRVQKGETQIGRSLVMTCYVPDTDQKYRFFYSRTESRGSATEVRIWMTAEGSPLKSIETITFKNGNRATAEARYGKDSISVTSTVKLANGRIGAFPTTRKVAVSEGTQIRTGLFDPMLLDPKRTVAETFYVLNAWEGKLDRYTVEPMAKSGASENPISQFVVSGPTKCAEIHVDQIGFLRNIESDGNRLVRDELRPQESLALESIAQQIKMPK
jgi:hypothetical protein